MQTERLRTRGISRKEIITYLIELGANPVSDYLYSGNEWSCNIDDEEYFFMFQSQIPMVNLEFSATTVELLEFIVKSFRKKIFRAGG